MEVVIWSCCFISIHAPTRGATNQVMLQPHISEISIHAPTRGATRCNFIGFYGGKFQSTLPRGERQIREYISLKTHTISIHAPTRGATQSFGIVRCICGISIHAPTRGATNGCGYHDTQYSISIHAPTRGATGTGALFPFPIRISIHAPTRGATKQNCSYGPYCKISIHAPTRGATDVLVRSALTFVFQSTLPRGERLRILGFQPEVITISIHAPTRGATLFQFVYRAGKRNFNPRSHEGSDPGNLSKLYRTGNFNPRSHEGSDVDVLVRSALTFVFQSTLPRGERHQGSCYEP